MFQTILTKSNEGYVWFVPFLCVMTDGYLDSSVIHLTQ
jgi:hypothetical protein